MSYSIARIFDAYMLSSRELRHKYIQFFLNKQHQYIQSSSLLPKDDPTVLFTTAGMQQLTPYLMGQVHPQGNKLCSVQKCVRTVDIDEVGDNRHLTFFEMLGNWSLGSYFKKEAIGWSYEFLTGELNIDPAKLWVTIFAGDQDIPADEESKNYWKELGMPEERIVAIGPEEGGKKGRGDNFWGPAGKHGPCGPSTEIFMYIGHGQPKSGQTPATDEDNFIEVWNNVFMEFHQDEAGTLTKLQQQNVDTGMGLERMVATFTGKPTVFETDIFEKIFAKIEDISQQEYPPYTGDILESNPITRAMRVMADHTRAATHIIADGGIPSNEGQGYVLRRLIRRAVHFGKKLGINKTFLSTLAEVHITDFAEFYPELQERKETILSTLKIEEENFFKTLERGEKMLEELLEKNPNSISGAEAFKLFDTYGFPLDLTKEIAAEKNVMIDEMGFYKEMKQQKERSRQGVGDFFDRQQQDRSGFEMLPKTEFVGYEQTECTSVVLFLQASQEKKDSHLMVEFALDKTPFYAESGGQVGDTGKVEGNGHIIKVWDVQKLPNGVFLHTGEIIQGDIKTGDQVTARIEIKRREQIKRHHSLAHLLHAALKKVLGDHVEQQGSLVEATRTRFDFSHPKALTPEEIRQIESLLSEWINTAHQVTTKIMPLDEAKAQGAEALFSEKYEDTVRTVRMGEESFELCGGTHVHNTADIGAIKITKEFSVASGIRRVELVCAQTAQDLLWQQWDEIQKISEKLKVPPEQIAERLQALFSEKKNLENELGTVRSKLIRFETDEFFELAQDHSGVIIVCEPVPTGDKKKIGAMARELVGRGVNIAAIFSRDGGVAVATTPDHNAKEILQRITAFAGGNGGGSPKFAQGAGVNLEEFSGIREVVIS